MNRNGKTAAIGLVIMFIAWVIAQTGKFNGDLTAVLCAVPIAIFAVIVYFYQPPKAKPPQPKDTSRRDDEQHLPQWVVNTRREMERNSQQGYDWRKD